MKIIAQPTQWESYSDSKILYLRCLDDLDGNLFESLRVEEEEGTSELVRVRHDVIFLQDFLSPAAEYTLTQILNSFGYAGLDAFVAENTDQDNFVYHEDGTIDHDKSPGYVIDRWLLASLIVEIRGGMDADLDEIRMSKLDALKMVKEITGIELPA